MSVVIMRYESVAALRNATSVGNKRLMLALRGRRFEPMESRSWIASTRYPVVGTNGAVHEVTLVYSSSPIGISDRQPFHYDTYTSAGGSFFLHHTNIEMLHFKPLLNLRMPMLGTYITFVADDESDVITGDSYHMAFFAALCGSPPFAYTGLCGADNKAGVTVTPLPMNLLKAKIDYYRALNTTAFIVLQPSFTTDNPSVTNPLFAEYGSYMGGAGLSAIMNVSTPMEAVGLAASVAELVGITIGKTALANAAAQKAVNAGARTSFEDIKFGSVIIPAGADVFEDPEETVNQVLAELAKKGGPPVTVNALATQVDRAFKAEDLKKVENAAIAVNNYLEPKKVATKTMPFSALLAPERAPAPAAKKSTPRTSSIANRLQQMAEARRAARPGGHTTTVEEG